MAVGPGGQQFGDPLQFVVAGGEERLLDPGGFGLLLGGEIEGETGQGRGLW